MRKLICTSLLIIVALGLAGCFGPKPVVRDYSLRAPVAGSGGPYEVEVMLGNDGPGGGQVQIEVDLVNHPTGEIIAQEIKDVDLQNGVSIRVQIQLDLPETLRDMDPRNIEARVEAHYPVE